MLLSHILRKLKIFRDKYLSAKKKALIGVVLDTYIIYYRDLRSISETNTLIYSISFPHSSLNIS